MIILTGGAGFVGSNLVKRLNRDGRMDILIVDNLKNSEKYRNLVGAKFLDLLPKEQFYDRLERGAWNSESVEAILHQGACTDTLEYDGAYMMRTNFEASKLLLDLALSKRVPMVYASTAAVYGHASEAVERPEAEAPLNVYGFSKLAFDNHVRRVASRIESTVVGLRYFNVYGHGEAHKGRMSSMVHQFANQIEATGVARLFGAVGPYAPGEQSRDFVSVSDLVEINLHFLNATPPVQSIVNAGSGVRSTWNQLAQSVIDALGRGTVEYVPFPEALRNKYQFDTRADLTQLRALGYAKPMTPLALGVRDYLSTRAQVQQPFLPRL